MMIRNGPARADPEAGYVLVSVLGVIATLAMAVAAMSVFTAHSMTVFASGMDRVRLSAAARAGLEAAALHIAAAPPSLPTQGRARLRLATGTVELSWRGEAGKVDLNAGAPELIQGILVRAGASSAEAEALTAAILARRSGSAPGSASLPPRPFRHVGELAVLGVPDAIAGRARPSLTVYGSRAQIDPRLASGDVLAALPGLTEARLRGLLALRDAGSTDWRAWTEQAGEAANLLSLAPSRCVRVRIAVQLDSGLSSVSQAVVASYPDDSEPHRVLSWEELASGDEISASNGDLP